MSQNLKRGIALTLVIVMVASVFSAVAFTKPVEAASAKKVAKVTAVKDWKKAPSVKIGDTKVTALEKRKENYIKFKASKAGTYEITFTNLNGGGGKKDIAYGAHFIIKNGKDGLEAVKVKTNKGEAEVLNVTTKFCWDNFDKLKSKKPTSYFYKRTATLKLKKGETIYFSSVCTSAKPKYSFNLNIKKK